MNVFLTGLGGCIGIEIKQLLENKGANVITHSKNKKADFNGDLSCPETVEEIFLQLKDVDAFVFCAGGKSEEKSDSCSAIKATYRQVLDDNLVSTVLCCESARSILSNKKRGHIITFGSYAACFGTPNNVPYAVSKAAVHSYSLCLATQLRKDNIAVNCIAAGNIATERFINEHGGGETGVDSLDRLGTPQEVAKLVSFLVLESSFISGQVIRIDGAKHTFSTTL